MIPLDSSAVCKARALRAVERQKSVIFGWISTVRSSATERSEGSGGPTWTRTRDQRIMSPLLF